MQIYRTEGLRALYRGVYITMFTSSLNKFIFFYVYTEGKTRYNYDPNNPKSWTGLFISARASLVAKTVGTPF